MHALFVVFMIANATAWFRVWEEHSSRVDNK